MQLSIIDKKTRLLSIKLRNGSSFKICRFYPFWRIFSTSKCHTSKTIWNRSLKFCMCYFLKLIKDCVKFEGNRRGSSWAIGWVDMEWPIHLLLLLSLVVQKSLSRPLRRVDSYGRTIKGFPLNWNHLHMVISKKYTFCSKI